MNNFECVVATLARHREARRWTDEAVAHELCAELGIDEAGEAKNATRIPVDPAITEAEVVAAETTARQAGEKAAAQRATFEANRRDAAAGDKVAGLSGDELRKLAEQADRNDAGLTPDLRAVDADTGAQNAEADRQAELDREAESEAAAERQTADAAETRRAAEEAGRHADEGHVIAV